MISAVTVVWSAAFNRGKLLTNDDLMRGDAIRPMAANVSENWQLVVDAATRISEHARDRGLRFREHYQSVNALSYLWAWYFIALRWQNETKLTEIEKDAFKKCLAEALKSIYGSVAHLLPMGGSMGFVWNAKLGKIYLWPVRVCQSTWRGFEISDGSAFTFGTNRGLPARY